MSGPGPLEWEFIARILLAGVLGMVIGIERETTGRAAGLRSCMLVSMSAALISCLSLHFEVLLSQTTSTSVLRMDPTRLPSYAIAGMGFLGAGAIIQGRLSARGVTTAAALWACTGIGLAVGADMLWPAVAVVGATLVTLRVVPALSAHLPVRQYVRLVIRADDEEAVEEVRALLRGYRAQVLFAGRTHQREGPTEVSFSLAINSGRRWARLLKDLEAIEGISAFSWQEDTVP